MAISFISHASAAATSVAVTTPVQGDIIVVFAYRNAVTAPSLITGYTPVSNASGNANSYRVMFKYSVGNETTTGVSTNASIIHATIYRGVGGIGAISGATKATATTATIPALTLQNTGNVSWVVAMAGHTNTTAQGTPLAGATTSRGTQAGTTSNSGVFDTNATVTSFSATTSSNGATATSSGISIELLPTWPDMSTLSDNFDTNVLDTTKWGTQLDNGSVTLVNTNQEIEITTTANTGYGRLLSNNFFNMNGSSAFGKLVDAGNQALSLDAIPLDISDTAGSNGFLWQIETNKLFAIYTLGGTQHTVLGSGTYTAGTHVWFRIRESGGTIFWDYATIGDGTDWTNYTSLAVTTFTYGLNQMTGGFLGGLFVSSTATTKYDNFNVSPTPPVVGTINFITYRPPWRS